MNCLCDRWGLHHALFWSLICEIGSNEFSSKALRNGSAIGWYCKLILDLIMALQIAPLSSLGSCLRTRAWFLPLKAINMLDGWVHWHPWYGSTSCLWVCNDKQVIMFTGKCFKSFSSTQPNINTKCDLLSLKDQCVFAV